MEITVDGIKIFYERYNGDGIPTVLLHGWGANSQTMAGIFNYLAANGKNVISVDFPLFGKSEPPPESFGVYEYSSLTDKFLKEIGVEKANIVGHSFGGRVGIILAAAHKTVNKLILVDAAGCKPRRGIKYRFRVLFYKLKRKLKIKVKNAGSPDYQALPDNMRSVFKRIVNTHLEKEFNKIDIPTLLIWGGNDRETPLYMAKRMNKKIKDSGLIIFKNAGHYSFLDNMNEFLVILNSFIS